MADRRLNGINPLSYMGVNPLMPPDMYTKPFAPTPQDYQNVELADLWLDTTTEITYILVSLDQQNISTLGGPAKWVPFTGGAGSVFTLTGNTGGAVSPLAGNINTVGDGTYITVTGNPATHTLTASLINGATYTNSFVTSSPVATPAATGGTAVPAANVLNIQGSHNISLSGGLPNTGAANDVVVWGNNAITLGDLTPLSADAGAVTCTTGDVIITAGDLTLPNTNAAGNQGIIKFGGNRFISNYGDFNTFVGADSGNTTLTVISAMNNTGVGFQALLSLTTGTGNVGVGNAALRDLTTGSFNSSTTSLGELISGSFNSGFGNALTALTTGSYNTALGYHAGLNYSGAESSNISIASPGVLGESNVCRIGFATGTGTQQLNKVFIYGIAGITTDVADAVPVLISASTSQLGTISSSLRYKENIKDMGSYSEDILKLRPVTFVFKNSAAKALQVGLIAEEVEKVMPRMTVYENGKPETVKYHDLPVLLLNEFQKQAHIIKSLQEKIDKLERKLTLNE